MKKWLIFLLLIPGVNAVTLEELFEDDTPGASPSQSWYSYSESDPVGTLNVTAANCTANQCLNVQGASFNEMATFGSGANQFDFCQPGANITFNYRISSLGGTMFDYASLIQLINTTSLDGIVWHVNGQTGELLDNDGGGTGFTFSTNTNYFIQVWDQCLNGVFKVTINNATTFTHTLGQNQTQLKFFGFKSGRYQTGQLKFTVDNINVINATPQPPVISSFIVSPTFGPANSSFQFTWVTSFATDCQLSINGVVVGSGLASNGTTNQTVAGPIGTKQVSLRCSNFVADTYSNTTLQIRAESSLAGPDGVFFGGDRGALAAAAQLSETALMFLYGILFVFIFGLIGLSVAGKMGGLGGALGGLIISLAIGLVPIWFLFLLGAAFVLIIYVLRRGDPGGV